MLPQHIKVRPLLLLLLPAAASQAEQGPVLRLGQLRVWFGGISIGRLHWHDVMSSATSRRHVPTCMHTYPVAAHDLDRGPTDRPARLPPSSLFRARDCGCVDVAVLVMEELAKAFWGSQSFQPRAS